MLSALGWVVAGYLVSGICVYLYAVAKSYEITGYWMFRIHKAYIGVCKYPYWLMGWMYWLSNKLAK